MRVLQKLVRCGNSTHFTIPRPALFWLGWLPGEWMVLELLEDHSIRVRRVDPNELAPKNPGRLVLDATLPGVV